ncbi:adenylosuccinate lyase, partial [Candidatus Woesearchaeota archaeon]|nr:adenylosuccinate lyase [Candidatus Woesearchaeota archaeon]
AGHPDAHEYARKATLLAEQQQKSFQDVLFNDAAAQPYLKKLTKQQLHLLQNPERYTGIAAEKTESVCRYWEKELKV